MCLNVSTGLLYLKSTWVWDIRSKKHQHLWWKFSKEKISNIKKAGLRGGWSGQVAGWSGQVAGWSGQVAGWSGQVAGWSGQVAGWSGEVAGCPNLKGPLRRHENNRKNGVSKVRFPHDKEFLSKLSAILQLSLKMFRQPSHRAKTFKAHQLAGAPSCWSARALGAAASSTNLGIKTAVCCIN
jgi:hypothetical protein